jgi:hypothetical protein
MRYNKYAMPVHPKVLEKDFETDQATFFNLAMLTKKLEQIDSLDDLDTPLLLGLNKFLHKNWFEINLRKGMNLKNREKMIPLFKQMNRLFSNNISSYPGPLYRGVRLSRVLGPTDLTDTYPYSMDSAKVLKHLEGLAYGLRSWISDLGVAEDWAKGVADGDTDSAIGRDLVIFKIRNPKIILKADDVMDYYSASNLPSNRMFDPSEFLIYLRNPEIVNIYTNKNSKYIWSPGETKIYYVVVEDR